VPPSTVTDGGADADAPEWIVAGELRLSPSRREVWSGDRKVALTDSEFGVLHLLMTAGDQGVTRDAIVKAGRLDEFQGRDAVETILARVRRKAGVRGQGNVLRKERVVTYFLDGAGTDSES
jgi:two-component system, OmpR family, response regulator MprA